MLFDLGVVGREVDRRPFGDPGGNRIAGCEVAPDHVLIAVDRLVGHLDVEGRRNRAVARDLTLPGVRPDRDIARPVVAIQHDLGLSREEGIAAVQVAHVDLDVRVDESDLQDGQAKLRTEMCEVSDQLGFQGNGDVGGRSRSRSCPYRRGLAGCHQLEFGLRGAVGARCDRAGGICRERDVIGAWHQVAVDHGLLVGCQLGPVGLDPAHRAAARRGLVVAFDPLGDGHAWDVDLVQVGEGLQGRLLWDCAVGDAGRNVLPHGLRGCRGTGRPGEKPLADESHGTHHYQDQQEADQLRPATNPTTGPLRRRGLRGRSLRSSQLRIWLLGDRLVGNPLRSRIRSLLRTRLLRRPRLTH